MTETSSAVAETLTESTDLAEEETESVTQTENNGLGVEEKALEEEEEEEQQQPEEPELIRPEDIKIEKIDLSDTSVAEEGGEQRKIGKYVCIECGKQFSYLKCFRSHQKEHSVPQTKGSPAKPAETQSPRNAGRSSESEWEQYVVNKDQNGKERLICNYIDCGFESSLRVVMKQHVINSHLIQNKRTRCPPKTHTEYEYWDKILFDKSGIRLSTEPKPSPAAKSSTPKAAQPKLTAIKPTTTPVVTPTANRLTITPVSTPKTPQNEPKVRVENEILAKKHLSIDKNKRDVLLSCKGLASMTKVSKYFVKRVVNGEKTYFCKFGPNCEFRTKKSQKIAEHINLSHIGVDFRCNKPNCNKVFKNPHSYREHQKNHICGFGSFGYGSKGVIGVCRNENLFKYRERIVIKGKKYYRCKCCQAITKYFTGMKRHIHSQHICPFRMNLHLTRHQTPIAIKQEIMDMDIDWELFGSGMQAPFIACLKCNEYFNSTEDLQKHEIMFCRFRTSESSIDETLNNEIAKQISFANKNKAANSESGPASEAKPNTKLKLSEQIRRNVNAINESITRHQSPAANGRFSDSVSAGLSLGMTFPPRIKIENEENEDMSDEEVRPSTSGLQAVESTASIEKYITIKCIDNEPNYFCAYDNCKYYTNDFIEIKNHVKTSHVLFACDVENCGKQFKNQTVLNAHRVNHVCGFGIKGRKSTGVCSLENVKKYRDERVINNRLVFPCKFIGCRYISETRNNALSHIHNRHICPNRVLDTGRPKTTTVRKKKAFIAKVTASSAVRQSIDESTSSSYDSSERPELEVLGTFGTQESLDNFAKYSKEVVVDQKTVFVCLFPNCLATPRNRAYCPEITDNYRSYSTDFKHNMIRHIRRHCNDRPFVCAVENCGKRFSCSSQFKNHQTSHSS